ncbi:glycosyltransferase family 4 protein [Thermodesulfobacteriota bacterium]
MKKIALAIENFSRFAGGAETYAVSLSKALVTDGWEVHLFGQNWDGEPETAIFHKITIPRFLPAWAKMLLFALRHRKMVREQNIDVIVGFGNTVYMNVYQSHGGVHRYSTARKVYAENNKIRRAIKRVIIAISLKQWMRNWIESTAFKQKKRPKIVAISQMIKEDMELFFNVNPEEIEIVYNGVDTTKYNVGLREHLRGPLRQQLGINKDEVIFLFVSYDLKKKGIVPLVDAVELLNHLHEGQFRIVVLGGSPYPSLSKRISSLGLNDKIIFTGKSRSTEEYYANSDVLVLPTYYDACSLVVIEAMACGLPPITTIYNGAAGIITNNRDGYVISHPPDPTELAAKMKSLMDRNKRRKMSQLAAEVGKRYSTEKNHEVMLQIFHDISEKQDNY